MSGGSVVRLSEAKHAAAKHEPKADVVTATAENLTGCEITLQRYEFSGIFFDENVGFFVCLPTVLMSCAAL